MSGYYTGTKLGSTGMEICVHPYKSKALKFDSYYEATSVSARFKRQFLCVVSSKVVEE